MDAAGESCQPHSASGEQPAKAKLRAAGTTGAAAAAAGAGSSRGAGPSADGQRAPCGPNLAPDVKAAAEGAIQKALEKGIESGDLPRGVRLMFTRDAAPAGFPPRDCSHRR